MSSPETQRLIEKYLVEYHKKEKEKEKRKEQIMFNETSMTSEQKCIIWITAIALGVVTILSVAGMLSGIVVTMIEEHVGPFSDQVQYEDGLLDVVYETH